MATDISASALQVTPTPNPKQKKPKEELVFGHTFTDHMLTVDWTQERGWEAPQIVPYGDLHISPAANCLHYAIECFEGMKAYKDKEGRVRLFRPHENMARMNLSANRVQLPGFDGEELLKCMRQLLLLDKDWIPDEMGYSLYIRPTMIGTQPSLGVGPSSYAKLYVITCPVGPYYPTGFKPVSLLADTANVRAWPGGTGNRKVGGNYGPTILPALEASKKGYAQVLWLYGPEHYVTEVGTMNCFALWQNETGEHELVTAPLDGTILPGVTRDSIITLAREWGYKVTERPFTMKEVVEKVEQGKMLEMFGAGTAAIVSAINKIGYNGTDYEIPLDPDNPDAGAGPLTSKVMNEILDIQYGVKEFRDWSVVVE